jgi:hypothetical protein
LAIRNLTANHTDPVAAVILHRTKIGKGEMKKSESIADGAVNFLLLSSFIYLRAFGNCAKGLLPGLARAQQCLLFIAAFPIVNQI